MNLLVIEDETSLRNSIIEYFTQENFVCETAGSLPDGLKKVAAFQYDCIILDICLPGRSGLKILEYLRCHEKSDSVIIISATDSMDDKIAGLNLGADSYLTKPFHLSELNARVRTVIRKKHKEENDVLGFGNLQVNLLSRSVTCGGSEILLNQHEYDLLVFLLNNKRHVVSRQALAEHICKEQAGNSFTVDFVGGQINHLKIKLSERGCGDVIQAVFGLGYKLSF